ncbi:hypothetical protein FRC12_003703 [Ceratobasidium sp. 428]|nr:hypothetical protein FRC12_003703 [Ceratobasidium sp. 428]
MLNQIIEKSGFGVPSSYETYDEIYVLSKINPSLPDVKGIVTYGAFQLTVLGSFLIMLGIRF